MIKSKTGRRNADGSLSIRRWEPPEVFLYGPYWKLERGSYRLDMHLAPIRSNGRDRIFCGLEVLAQNRHFLAVADYCRSDIVDGKVSLIFEMPQMLADHEATVEFRVLNLGGIRFDIAALDLTKLSDASAPASGALRWRLAPRLYPTWLMGLASVLAPPHMGIAPGAYALEPPLRLPMGRYELCFRARRRGFHLRKQAELSIGITIGEQWSSASTCSVPKGSSSLHTIEFNVPPEVAYDHGADAPLKLTFGRLPRRSVVITDLILTHMDVTPSAREELGAPAIGNLSTPRVVIIGNCQAEMIATGLRRWRDTKPLTARYHFVGLAGNLLDSARADLKAANRVLVQDIAEFSSYPLSAEIPKGVELHRFPMLRLSTPWPYDFHNGSVDREAELREQTEPFFPNLDGALGRLRKQMPDPEVRFQAYRRLDFKPAVDLARLARFEERRLTQMDEQYGFTLGAYILENFRKQRLFHSIGHPDGRTLSLLLDHLNRVARLAPHGPPARSLNSLKNIQVPVHPLVAKQLGIRWATQRTRYEFRGQMVTWEQYTRLYIKHFG